MAAAGGAAGGLAGKSPRDPGGAPAAPAEEQEVLLTCRQQALRSACIFFNVMCGLTNGYDICVASAVLGSMVSELELCDHAKDGGMTSCSRKQVADRFGRRAALAFVDCLIIAATTLQCTAESAEQLLAGRFVLGLGLGLAFVVEPSYICEIAPPAKRGQYVVLNEVAVCVGCLLGLQAGTAFQRRGGPGAWRMATALGAVPAVLQLACIFALPESPRWLAVRGDLVGLARTAEQLGLSPAELEGLVCTARQASDGGYVADSTCWQLLERQRRAWREHGHLFLLALGFSFFVPTSGVYAMQAYAADVLRLCGVEEPMLWLPLMGWAKLAGALTAVAGADAARVGRRRLAICGSGGCFIAQSVIAWHLEERTLPPTYAAVAFFAFLYAWNAGYGGIQFVAMLEILPNDVRSVWAGQIFAVCGVTEVMIYQLFETLLVVNGVVLFIAFAAINLVAVLFAAFLMSDLQGKALEEGAGPAVSRAAAAVEVGQQHVQLARLGSPGKANGAARRREPGRQPHYGKIGEHEEEDEQETANQVASGRSSDHVDFGAPPLQIIGVPVSGSPASSGLP